MSRELDGLMNTLERINADMGGDDKKKKKGKNDKVDRFNELKKTIGERLHKLKFLLQDPEGSKKPKHPREAIKRQQEIREDLRQCTVDIAALKATLEAELKKKKSKFSPEELKTRGEILEQYTSELAMVKELSAATYMRNSPSAAAFLEEGFSSGVGNFENGRFVAGRGGVYQASNASGIGGGMGGGGGGRPGSSSASSDTLSLSNLQTPAYREEEVTDEQRQVLQEIKSNDHRFDEMIEQIGVGVTELGQLARTLNDELEEQTVMIDGLESRIDTTQAHVENINTKMRHTLEQVGRSGDKCIMDLICIILLLGILAVVYNMFFKSH